MMEAAGEDEKVITYTDLVGTLMSSVTDIVNIISYVLVAFVAISLVVSSIMIGVITYISVLEKEKRNWYSKSELVLPGTTCHRCSMRRRLLSDFAQVLWGLELHCFFSFLRTALSGHWLTE